MHLLLVSPTLIAGAAAGIIAGLIAGLGARTAMRLVALGVTDASQQVPSFTIEGTAGIVIAGGIAGAPLGTLYAKARERLPGSAPARGLVFGALLLASLGPLFYFGAMDELVSVGRVVVFAIVFLVFGTAAAIAFRSLGRSTAWAEPVRAVLALVAIGGALFLLLGIAGIVGPLVDRHGALGAAALIPPLAWAGLLWRRHQAAELR